MPGSGSVPRSPDPNPCPDDPKEPGAADTVAGRRHHRAHSRATPSTRSPNPELDQLSIARKAEVSPQQGVSIEPGAVHSLIAGSYRLIFGCGFGHERADGSLSAASAPVVTPSAGREAPIGPCQRHRSPKGR
jgi:hypothetical protein